LNAVRQRERSKTARHEAGHVAAAYFLGEVLDDVEITPPRDAGYVTGICAASRDPRIGAVVLAVGCLDGHGSGADEFELEQWVPNPDVSAEVLAVAERLMEHRQFRAVRNALWRRLQFADVMHHDEIAKIATAAVVT
jgi:hypothetical protein